MSDVDEGREIRIDADAASERSWAIAVAGIPRIHGFVVPSSPPLSWALSFRSSRRPDRGWPTGESSA